jgi:RNA polymerase sigma factor (sigma-70 family)
MGLSFEPGTTDHKQINAVVEHLFRHEYGKLVSMLVRTVGIAKLDDVEDAVQEALMAAMTGWSFRGLPGNPTGWLIQVARNKLVDLLRHQSLGGKLFVPLVPGFHDATYAWKIEKLVLPGQIEDAQLRMMFSCCHPGIPAPAQIALTLKTLCGFSVREIASAFLTKEDAIEKRLTRARKHFRDHNVELEAPAGRALRKRRSAVLASLYLLFNEGYKQTESEGLFDRDLCLEAIRLARIMAEHPLVRAPESLALVALMTLVAARFETRTNDRGDIVLLSEQDRGLWNRKLIAEGMDLFARSEPDIHTSAYHLEAAIQALHVMAPSFEQTDWPAILGLYKRLYELKPSPVVAMHMSVSMSQVHGPTAAIALLESHPLADYYLYHAILGDALTKDGRHKDAERSFTRAIKLTRNAREKVLLEKRLAAITVV